MRFDKPMESPPWPDAIRGHWRGIINVYRITEDIYIVYFWEESYCLIVDAHASSEYYIDTDWRSDAVMDYRSAITTPYTDGHEYRAGKWYLDGVITHDGVHYDDKFVVITDVYDEWIVFRQ